MTREQLIIGQWYKVGRYGEYYYQFLSIEDRGIKGNYLTSTGYRSNYFITNEHFWDNKIREAEYLEYEKFLPEQYKTRYYEIY